MSAPKVNVSSITSNGQLDPDKLTQELNKALLGVVAVARQSSIVTTIKVSVGATLETPYPILVRLNWNLTPHTVIVSKVLPETGGNPVFGSSADWEPWSDGIRVKHISGLDANQKYTITLLVLGGS